MARGFGATLGVGTTDKVATTYATASTQQSYALWTNQHGNGALGFGVLFAQVGGATPSDAMYNTSPTQWDIGFNWSTTSGLWRLTRPLLDAWHSVVVTYDGSSTSNDPVVYIDGSPASLTEITTPVGSRASSGDVFNVGNRADGALGWDGQHAEFAIWNRILSASEAAAHAKGFSPLFSRQGLKEYVPLLRDNVSRYNAAPTITGTAIRPHPRVIYPSSPWRIVVQPGGAPSTSGDAALHALGLLTTAGIKASSTSLILGAFGQMAAVTAKASTSAAALAGQAHQASTGTKASTGTAGEQATGQISALASSARSAQAALRALGILASTSAAPAYSDTAALVGVVRMTASGARASAGTAVTTAYGRMALATVAARSGVAAFRSGSTLRASGASSRIGTAAMWARGFGVAVVGVAQLPGTVVGGTAPAGSVVGGTVAVGGVVGGSAP